MSSGECDVRARSVTVVVRMRGENAREAEQHQPPVAKVVDDKVIVFDPKTVSSPEFYHGRKRRFRDLNKRANRNVYFGFDRVFDEFASNVDVFESTTKSIVDDVVNGYNACVFAYGATGAGKTFTMLGTIQNPGVIFQSVMALYTKIECAQQQDKMYDVSVSYLEVYNEQLRDLLAPGTALALREDAKGDVVVAGLTVHRPSSATELLNMLESGNKNRTQHPTDANAESSRSHAVFQVYVKQHDRTANTTTNIKAGKLSLIDLAGSERASVTKNRGARFLEGSNINRSLLALGNCINALADGKSKGYVPYRNSKLTRLLKDSLGGNCRTVMIAAISPSSLSYEDTYNTLKYANRAKEIKVDLKQNSLQVENHLSQYPKMVHDLRQQVADLQEKLLSWETGKVHRSPPPSSNNTTLNTASNDQITRLKETEQKVFECLVNQRKELMELEGSERILSLKINKKQLTLGRLHLLVDDTDHCKTIGELQRSINAAQQRMNRIIHRKKTLEGQIQQNTLELCRVGNEMKTLTGAGTHESVELLMRCHQLEIDLRDTRQHTKYLKKIARIQQRESVATEKLVRGLLRSVRHNFFILKGNSLTTDAMSAEFTGFQLLLRGSSEVAWQDQELNCTSTSATTLAADCSSSIWSDGDFEKLLYFPVSACKVTPVGSVQRVVSRSASNSSTPSSRSISHRLPLSASPNQSTCSQPSSAADICDTTYIVVADKLLGCSPRLRSPVVSQCSSSLQQNDSADTSLSVTQLSAHDETVAAGPPPTAILCRPPVMSSIASSGVLASVQRPALTSNLNNNENMSPCNKPLFIGKLTFADVVKSPIVSRSPLMSRENLPNNNNMLQNSCRRPLSLEKCSSSIELSDAAVCSKSTNYTANGLVASRQTTDMAVRPSYMQLTRAAAYRYQSLTRCNSMSLADTLRRPVVQQQQQQQLSRVPSHTNMTHGKPGRVRSSSSNIHINSHLPINNNNNNNNNNRHRRGLMF